MILSHCFQKATEVKAAKEKAALLMEDKVQSSIPANDDKSADEVKSVDTVIVCAVLPH